MSFYRDTIRTARKEHKCGICHGVIKIGEKYHDKAGKHDGDLWHGKECEPCQPVIDEFNESDCADEGYCDEYIQEWWREEKCPVCKHYWLPCEPDEVCLKQLIKPNGSCPERTKYNTCEAGDICGDMTHYCRCEKFEKEN